MAASVNIESAMQDVANYIVGPNEAETMLKRIRKNSSYMDGIKDSDIDVLINTLDFLRFQPNDPLISKGEEASWCGFIVEGSVGVVVGDKQVASMPEGKLLGGMAYFFGSTRTADCCGGETGGVIAAIEFDELKRLEEDTPDVALRFLTAIGTGELENLLSRIDRMENGDKPTEAKKPKRKKNTANAKHKAEVLYRSKAAAAAKEAKRIKAMMDRQAREVAKMKASKKNEKHVMNKLNRQLKEKDDKIKELMDEKKSSHSNVSDDKLKKQIKQLKKNLATAKSGLIDANKTFSKIDPNLAGISKDELITLRRDLRTSETSNAATKAQLIEQHSRIEHLLKERNELLAIAADGQVDEEEQKQVAKMLEESAKERKNMETRYRFLQLANEETFTKLNEALDNVRKKDTNIAELEEEMGRLGATLRNKDGEANTAFTLSEKARNRLEQDLKHSKTDLMALKMLTKMLHDGTIRRDRKIVRLSDEIVELKKAIKLRKQELKELFLSNETFSSSFIASAHESEQLAIRLRFWRQKYDSEVTNLIQSFDQKTMTLKEEQQKNLNAIRNKYKALVEEGQMEKVKQAQEYRGKLENLNLVKNEEKRQLVLRMQARLDEYAEDKTQADRKLVVNDIRLKETMGKLETVEEELQQSRVLCANLTSSIKSLDWAALTLHRQRAITLQCLTDVAQNFFVTHRRKAELEQSFGGLTKTDILLHSNMSDFPPEHSHGRQNEHRDLVNNHLGLSPRGKRGNSRVPQYMSLMHLAGGNDIRRGHDIKQKLIQQSRPLQTTAPKKTFKKRQQAKHIVLKAASFGPTPSGTYTKTVQGSENQLSVSHPEGKTPMKETFPLGLKGTKEPTGFGSETVKAVLQYLCTATKSYASKFDVYNAKKHSYRDTTSNTPTYRSSMPLINFKALTAIVIDHHQEMLKSTVTELKKSGIGMVHTARTIEVARSVFATKIIDIVLIRYWMPEGTAEKTIKKLWGTSASSQNAYTAGPANLRFWSKALESIVVITTYDPQCRAEQDAIFAADASGKRLSKAWTGGGSMRQIVKPLNVPLTDCHALSLPLEPHSVKKNEQAGNARQGRNSLEETLYKAVLGKLCKSIAV